jgi:hypothetical protein
MDSGLSLRSPRNDERWQTLLPHSRALAALALHDIVALLDQALAFAILAFLLLLDVRALIIGHANPSIIERIIAMVRHILRQTTA